MHTSTRKVQIENVVSRILASATITIPPLVWEWPGVDLCINAHTEYVLLIVDAFQINVGKTCTN